MEEQLWNLFRETGDPMGYLLYSAEKKQTKQKKSGSEQKTEQAPEHVPTVSG